MNYKTIRIAGKSYVIFSLTPKTAERVISTLRGFNVQDLKDIPEGTHILSEVISIAITGSGLLNRFKVFLIRRRIIRKASIESLIEVTAGIIEMIPATEFYNITAISNQFQKVITK